MKRKGQWFDNRVKLEKGDYVKINKKARQILKRNEKLTILPSETFIVKNIEFDAGQGRRGLYLVTVQIKGDKVDLYLSDVTFAY